MIGKLPNPPMNADLNKLCQSEIHSKNVEAVENMFIKAGFFEQFMNIPVPAQGGEPPHPPGYANQNNQFANGNNRPTMGVPFEPPNQQQPKPHAPYSQEYPMQSTKRM